MASKHSTYQISFTSGSLFYRDAIKLAEMYADLQDWNLVSQRVVRENTLQSRTASSLDRLTHELVQRLQTLTPAQLQILIEGTRQEQNQILWLAVCKHYLFVREFAVQVIREKYLRLDWELTHVDFDSFFYAKAEWDEHLEKIKESTRKKLRQVLFLMLTEAGIISSINLIVPVLFSPALARAIHTDDRSLFTVFPISDADIRNLSL